MNQKTLTPYIAMKTVSLLWLTLLLASFEGFAQCAFSDYDLQDDTLSFSIGLHEITVPAGSKAVWPFHAEIGKVYSFSTCTSSEDTYLELFTSIGEQVVGAANDDDGLYCMGGSASLSWQCAKSGLYYVGLGRYECGRIDEPVYLQFGHPGSQSLSSALVYAYTNSGGGGEEKLQAYLLNVIVDGLGDPIVANDFLFEFTPLGNSYDFKSAELYYIGQDEYFYISEFKDGSYSRVGEVAFAPSGKVEFEESIDLFTGNNYFALVVSVADKATVGNTLSVQMESFTLDGGLMLADPIEGEVEVSAFAEQFIDYDWYWGSVNWADVDADGDFDLMVSEGLFQNNRGRFDIKPIGATSWANFTEFVDFNNDSLVDLITSEDGTVFDEEGQVYINKGDLTFSEVVVDKMPLFWNDGGIATADINHDGKDDVLYCGYIDERAGAYVFLNDGESFTEAEGYDLVGLDYSALDVGDYNNDGFVDLIMCGENKDGEYITVLYQNDNGKLVQTAQNFEGVADGSVVFGDFDLDGDLDVLLSGITDYYTIDPVTVVYENIEGSFSEKYFNIKGICQGQASWVDYDADGDLDIHLYGTEEYDGVCASMFYENKNGDFLYDDDYGFFGTTYSLSNWADIDADGDPDFVLNGYDANDNIVVYVYTNHLGGNNQKPSVPEDLHTKLDNMSVRLEWERSSDKETADEALRYNVRLGTEPGMGDIVSAKALHNGRQLMPDCSNAGSLLYYEIDSLPPGEYFWTVQAVDLSGNASGFAQEMQFFVALPPQICVVTSSEKGENLVAWERYKNRGVKEYIIYRESEKTDEFVEIGRLLQSELSVFVDSASNIQQKSYSYRISSVDSSDFETELSEAHRTIHLMTGLSYETPAKVNLEWNFYEGVPVESYEIYRGTAVDGLELIKTLSGNENSYSDLMPQENTFYRVYAKLPAECNPLQLKTDSGPFSHSLSNISEVELGNTGFPDAQAKSFVAYPLPCNELLTVESVFGSKGTYVILDSSGKAKLKGEFMQEKSVIDVSGLRSGYYLLVIEDGDSIISIPLPVE